VAVAYRSPDADACWLSYFREKNKDKLDYLDGESNNHGGYRIDSLLKQGLAILILEEQSKQCEEVLRTQNPQEPNSGILYLCISIYY
jgi:hypothetical protein